MFFVSDKPYKTNTMIFQLCYYLMRFVMFIIMKFFIFILQIAVKVKQLKGPVTIIVIVLVLLWFWSVDDSVILEERHSNASVILWWTEGFPNSLGTKFCENNLKCEVHSTNNMTYVKYLNVQAYLFYGSNINFKNMPPRRPSSVIWGLYHEESPRNVEELMHEPVLRLFNYSSTFSRYSDVPFPLQHLESFNDINSKTYFVPTLKKNEYLNDIAPVLYLQSDCETSTERDLYVKELMETIKVDCYGVCLNNKKLPEKFTHDYLNNLNEHEFLNFVARYKFVISIENGACDDYVTEKFWRAIKVGSVPIYFGDPLIRDWLPNEKSAILLEDYPKPSILSKHLNKLLNDDALYEQYLEHKTKGLVTNSRLTEEYHKRSYQLDALQTIDKFECFICSKIHNKIKGKPDVQIVNKKHYNCPKPLSALQLDVNPENSWVYTWDHNRDKAEKIYNNVMNNV